MKFESEEQTQSGRSRTYKMKVGTRRILNRLSIFFVVFLTLLSIVRSSSSSRDLLWADIVLVGFVVWVSERVNRRVILSEDAIELAGWLSKRILTRKEILGRRMSLPNPRGGYHYIIVPIKGREMVLPPYLNTDRYFHSWISEIPKT